MNVRGHEGDAWKGEVADPEMPEHLERVIRQDWVNRKYITFCEREEKLTPQARTFAAGLEFLQTNREQDNWYLQIETFDQTPRAVFHAETTEGPLQLRLGRPALRLAELCAGDRGSGCRGVPALPTDPGQLNPIEDVAVEARMIGMLKEALAAHEAPPEQYQRLGLSGP